MPRVCGGKMMDLKAAAKAARMFPHQTRNDDLLETIYRRQAAQ